MALALLSDDPAAAAAFAAAPFDAIGAAAAQAMARKRLEAWAGIQMLLGLLSAAPARGEGEALACGLTFEDLAARLARERPLLASLAARAGAGPEEVRRPVGSNAAGAWRAVGTPAPAAGPYPGRAWCRRKGGSEAASRACPAPPSGAAQIAGPDATRRAARRPPPAPQMPAIVLLYSIAWHVQDAPFFPEFASTPGLLGAAARAVAAASGYDVQRRGASLQLAVMLASQQDRSDLRERMAGGRQTARVTLPPSCGRVTTPHARARRTLA